MNLKKKMEGYLWVILLGPGPHLMKKEFTRPRSHKGWGTLLWNTEQTTKGNLITKPVTHPELIMLQYLIQISLPNKLLHFVFVHIHPVVKITTPEYIVMRVECTTLKLHHLKCHFCVSANPYKQMLEQSIFLPL